VRQRSTLTLVMVMTGGRIVDTKEEREGGEGVRPRKDVMKYVPFVTFFFLHTRICRTPRGASVGKGGMRKEESLPSHIVSQTPCLFSILLLICATTEPRSLPRERKEWASVETGEIRFTFVVRFLERIPGDQTGKGKKKRSVTDVQHFTVALTVDDQGSFWQQGSADPFRFVSSADQALKGRERIRCAKAPCRAS